MIEILLWCAVRVLILDDRDIELEQNEELFERDNPVIASKIA